MCFVFRAKKFQKLFQIHPSVGDKTVVRKKSHSSSRTQETNFMAYQEEEKLHELSMAPLGHGTPVSQLVA